MEFDPVKMQLSSGISKIEATSILADSIGYELNPYDSNQLNRFYNYLIDDPRFKDEYRFFGTNAIRSISEESCTSLASPIFYNGVPDCFPIWDWSKPFITHTPPLTCATFVEAHVGFVYDAPVIFDAQRSIERSYSSYFSLLYPFSNAQNRIDFNNAPYLDGDLYVMLDDIGGLNFSHWIADYLPRLAILPEKRNDIFVLTLPMKTPWQLETLKSFGISADQIVSLAPWQAVRARRILVPSGISHIFHPSYKGADWALESIRSRLLSHPSAEKAIDRIYLSRKDAAGRRIVNEDAFEDLLTKHGFKTIVADGMTVLQQADVFHNASLIISVHGAGLTNVAFCGENSKILEIFPKSYGTPAFWILSAANKSFYSTYICNNVVKGQRSQLDDLHIDLDEFSKVLQSFVS